MKVYTVDELARIATGLQEEADRIILEMRRKQAHETPDVLRRNGFQDWQIERFAADNEAYEVPPWADHTRGDEIELIWRDRYTNHHEGVAAALEAIEKILADLDGRIRSLERGNEVAR